MTITISDIKEWLEGELELWEDVADAKINNEPPVNQDDSDDYCYGKYKCAEQLLMFIKRKEKNGTSK